MFTGLIEATGTIAELKGPRIRVSAPGLAARLQMGDSVAVNGVCLTALDLKSDEFSADLAAETLARTTLGGLGSGAVVNLELPTAAGAPLGGHVVQGHVDGVGELLALTPVGGGAASSDWRLRIRIPSELVRYVVGQGSITIEGISLTVASIAGDVVEVAIIPHTYAATNLHSLVVGAGVNIEVDVLGKYAERQMQQVSESASQQVSEFCLTEAYLLANGY